MLIKEMPLILTFLVNAIAVYCKINYGKVMVYNGYLWNKEL